MSPRRRTVVPVLALALVATACGGGEKDTPITTETTVGTTTTAPPTVGFPAGAAPLTGQPGNADLLNRPALVVKIDNAPKARPQAGINQADIVIEEKVEDGVVRLFTIFQSQDADPVGPVRSARTTDIALVTPLNRPLFSYSGANARFDALIRNAPLVNVGHNAASGEYRRDRGRPAPYNLFTATAPLFRRAPAGAGAPQPQLQYRLNNAPLANAGAAPAAGLHIEYRGDNITTIVDYAWDGASATWRRTQDGAAHVDAAGVQVAPRNVVLAFTEYIDTGERDQSNTIVPEGKVVGEGEAWVFTDGRLVKGKWSKPSPEAVMAFTDSAGAPIGLTPGQTWIELPPPGAASTS